jgi:arabinogalactan oligomer/maltooligosaccharide transport system substrate-binding protein
MPNSQKRRNTMYRRSLPLLFLVAALLVGVALSADLAPPSTAQARDSVSFDLDVDRSAVVAGSNAPERIALQDTVSLWHPWTGTEEAALHEVIATFLLTHLGVVFDVQHVAFDNLRAQIETAVAGGGGPSVLIGAADWGPPLYDEGRVADLSGLASPALLATINDAALGAVQYKGALIGLPETTKGVLMYRNKNIIAAAPTTYQELVTAAQAATGGGVDGADLERGFFFAAAHLHGLGGQLMDSQGSPSFNNQQGVEWVNLLDSFSDAGPTEYYTDDDLNQFKAGTVGIIIDGTWNLEGIRSAIGSVYLAIDPWPTPLSGYVQTENLYLSPNAAGGDLTASWVFMEFSLSTDAQETMLTAGHIPSVEGVTISDPLLQQAVVAMAGGTALPVIPQMGAYWGPMDTALKSVFDSAADPAQALQEAYDSILAALAEMGFGCYRVYLPITTYEH